MPRSVSILFLALFSRASADYPAHGNGLIQKDTVKAAILQTQPVDDTVISGEDAANQMADEIADTTASDTDTPASPSVPDTLAGYITHTLLPKADDTITMLDTDVKKARDKVESCGSHIEGMDAHIQAGEANLARQERKLAMCLRVKNGETIKEEEFCEEWHAAAKNFNPKTLDNAKGNLKTYENILKTYYDFYPKFMKEEAKCREMIAIMHSQDKHCTFRLKEIERVYCDLKQNRTSVCNKYDRCYAGAKADYEWVKGQAAKLEDHTKKVVKALKCFQEHSSSLEFAPSIDHQPEARGSGKSFPCNPSKWNTQMDNYNLKVSVLPAAMDCVSEIQNPPRKSAIPAQCDWEPKTTVVTTPGTASGGPSQGTSAVLLQDSANLDATSFSKVEEYLADAESVLKKIGMQ